MTKLIITMNKEEFDLISEDKALLVTRGVWIGQDKSNKQVDTDNDITDDEVVIHVSVDSIFDVVSVHKFKEITDD